MELEHRSAIEDALARYRPGLSEYSFANLFLFRHAHNYRFREGALPAILGRTYDGEEHVMPLFEWRNHTEELLAEVRAARAIVYPIAESNLPSLLPAGAVVSWRPDDADYLYATKRMGAYSGSALKAKRRLAELFVESCAPSVAPIEPVDRERLQTILDGWLRDVGRPIEATDYSQCVEALEHLDDLGLFGLIASDREGAPRAFVLASEVTEGMAAIHFAKARRSPDGALPFLFRAFARVHGPRYSLLNFEQDLGNPGFRQNKRSYAPVRQAQKLRLASATSA